MTENIPSFSNRSDVKHHTIEVIVDLSQFDLPIKYSNPAIRVILDSGLYIILEKMRSYLKEQPKAGKKQKKLKAKIKAILISLGKKTTVSTTQGDTKSEIQQILTEVELEWKKIFANFFIKTKDHPHWERLMMFREKDFKHKDFDPKEAMKDALERFN